MEFDQTTLQIDLDVLEENLENIHRAAATKIMAVVKADAYGLGSVVVAQFLEGKCDFFGVANLAEALKGQVWNTYRIVTVGVKQLRTLRLLLPTRDLALRL